MLQPGVILLNRYVIQRRLGGGGMGTVYLAGDGRLGGRAVALKQLVHDPTATFGDRAEAERLFRDEALLLARLSHPNLPRVSDCFTEGGESYLVMDFVDGQTLQDVMDAAAGPLAEDQVLAWARQLCDVLGYLHRQQPPVIFRDLKAANIMVDRSGAVKLIDFGIARLFKPGKATDTLRMGTMGYAPPEQFAGHGQTDARSDIYGLGVTLHYLLTGRDPAQHPPFSAGSTPLRGLNPHISWQTEAAIAASLAYDPAARFQNAAAFAAALPASAGASMPVAPPRVAAPTIVAAQRQGAVPVRGASRGGRSRGRILAAGFVIVALIAVVWFASRASRPAASGAPPVLTTPAQTQPPPVTSGGEPAAAGGVLATLTPLPTMEVPTEVAPTSPPRTAILPTEPPPTEPPPSVVPPTEPPPTKPVPASADDGWTGTIAFHSDRSGDNEIYVMRADGTNVRRLTYQPGNDFYPALSPDGSHVAFVSERDGNAEIYVTGVEGSGETRLTFASGEDRLPAWSPDGRRLAFNSDRDGADLDLYIMDADGGSVTRLTSGPERDGHVSWAPDGQRLVYNTGMTKDGWELFTLYIPADFRTQVTVNGVMDWSPNWSPVGERVVYLTWRNSRNTLATIDADGSNMRVVLDSYKEIWGPAWSPGGQYIAFASTQSGRDELYVVPAEGGAVRQLTAEGGAYPSWSW